MSKKERRRLDDLHTIYCRFLKHNYLLDKIHFNLKDEYYIWFYDGTDYSKRYSIEFRDPLTLKPTDER